MRTIRELAHAIDPARVRAAGAIRRMAITLTAKVLWQLTGFRLPDGTTETALAEVFGGIGFFARPPSGSKPEAIVLMVGDANTPVIVALRDEQTRAKVAGAFKPNESGVFNTLSIVYVKDDGTIEARSTGGTAKRLATNDDLAALINILATWVVVPMDGGAALKTAIQAYQTAHPTWPAGTSKLKGE